MVDRNTGGKGCSHTSIFIVVLAIVAVLCVAAVLIVFHLGNDNHWKALETSNLTSLETAENHTLSSAREGNEERDVLIFSATPYFGREMTTEGTLQGCKPVTDWCRITTDAAELSNASAVVFHNRDYYPNYASKMKRNPDVLFVIYSRESPTNDPFPEEPNVMNWTMTYRRDSDVSNQYAYMVKLKNPIKINFEEIWSVKTKTAAWLASNCYTANGRTELVEELMKAGLPIDRWGACGRPVRGCDRSRLYDHCVVDLIKPYKFYMSFENTNCKDYVTEKFYLTMKDRLAVPVVIKRSIYEDLGIPRDSFIALDDFENVNELAAFVMKVASNKTAYLEYHKWRTDYGVIDNDFESYFCGLCRKLRRGISKHKSYENLYAWNADGMCDNKYTFKFFSK